MTKEFSIGRVTVSLPSFEKLEAFAAGTTDTSSLLKAWIEIYRSAMRQRYIKFSRGGGDWPPLKQMRWRNYKAAVKISRKILTRKGINTQSAEYIKATQLQKSLEEAYYPKKFNRNPNVGR